MAISLLQWTIEDYHRMIDSGILDDRSVELLKGQIITMSPEGIPHAYFSDATADYLRNLLGNRAKVREGKPITLFQSSSEPEPDLAIVEPLGTVYLEHHPYPNNIFWLIEFSNSSLTKDLEEKSKVYATENIREYWVVNLRNQTLIMFKNPQQGDYQSQEILTQGDIYPLAFPDVAVSVQRLLVV
ncbi:Uma2 family endonuclease [Planktothrix pseudagardhii]|uniref:Putative restriction endonuclease domain-containing protein n=1 Tax=Planktothrix pseudagardhii TaxID=132604 RepID=A0A9W4CT40_9CYAN|nr:Uma2 family endonuclease [Planktothrix pseudagardhii]CAD5962058.1 hypothetical protein NO713_03264 [Planktothrix pseudagardhii]